MTDVTGFGLAGHLIEMCKASQASALIEFDELPVIDPAINYYIDEGCIPGGTNRNYSSYSNEIDLRNPDYKNLVCDPQTSGGLLIAVSPGAASQVAQLLTDQGLYNKPIGVMIEGASKWVTIQ